MSKLSRFMRRSRTRRLSRLRRLPGIGRFLPLRVAIVGMVKNEGVLLPLWFAYHSKLFGPQNIFLFDNGSTDPDMLATLKALEAAGAYVDYGYGQAEDYGRKGKIISKTINRLMADYDFLVPLDGDELLTMPGDGLLDRRGAALFRHLRSLASRPQQFFRIGSVLRNHPGTSLVSATLAKKVIIKRGPPVKLGKGFHLFDWDRGVDTLPAGQIAPSDLIHVHFSFRDFEGMVRAAREKLKLHTPDFHPETLKQQLRSENHVRHYIAMTEDQYYAAEAPGANAIDLAQIFSARGLGGIPFAKNARADPERIREFQRPENAFYDGKPLPAKSSGPPLPAEPDISDSNDSIRS